ncbi:GNAT family N-acetyltransferase [Haloterrigena alkaliphila]|uniref:GNAT family N-acetyltransferase n=1 Tax=Haloterrigena alkaliphila TaxID=2816475 RepID=A0A8A2VHH7_9EURY|nr:GNAT family N-acetyltransferase [Haloterrigena alkaliphila]QSW97688.1 GNAT family N-acetyltransferase [Haloterrigena alkaliphila]
MTANACTGWDNTGCEGTEYCPPRCPRFVDRQGTALLIRPYDPDRYDALVAMYESIQTSTMGLPPSRRETLERWIHGLAADGWNLLATLGDDVVGHVAVVPADATDPEFVIFVHPEFQDRGIGTELLQQVVAYADDRNYDELNLNVSREQRRAIAVYEKVGFDVTATNQMDLEMRLPLADERVAAVQKPPATRDR